MQQFGDFIVENWQWLITLIMTFLAVFTALLKKKKIVVSDIFADAVNMVLIKLPEFIKSMEISELEGKDKKQLVITACFQYITTILNRDLESYETSYLEGILSTSIEKILSTPTKKC